MGFCRNIAGRAYFAQRIFNFAKLFLQSEG